MNCKIESCKGKDSCLEHCPCDCHKKQFCDCYEHDFRSAVRKLAEIVDMQVINDSTKTTASMYVNTAHEINKERYIKSLEEQLKIMREQKRQEIAETISEVFLCGACRGKNKGILDKYNLI